jgi:hypothetical protein
LVFVTLPYSLPLFYSKSLTFQEGLSVEHS